MLADSDTLDDILADGAGRARRGVADSRDRTRPGRLPPGEGLTGVRTPPRLFGVAINIPEPFNAELSKWRHELGDPQASAVPPHVTLLPPTPLADALLPEVEEHLRAIAEEEEPFDIHLSGSGTFRPISPVVFVPLARELRAVRGSRAACAAGCWTATWSSTTTRT